MSPSFMDSIDTTKNHVTRMMLFVKIKTGDPIIDTFLTTVILGIFSWLVNLIYENQIDKVISNLSFDDFKCFFLKKIQLL